MLCIPTCVDISSSELLLEVNSNKPLRTSTLCAEEHFNTLVCPQEGKLATHAL